MNADSLNNGNKERMQCLQNMLKLRILKKYMLIFDLILATPFKNTGKGLVYQTVLHQAHVF